MSRTSLGLPDPWRPVNIPKGPSFVKVKRVFETQTWLSRSMSSIFSKRPIGYSCLWFFMSSISCRVSPVPLKEWAQVLHAWKKIHLRHLFKICTRFAFASWCHFTRSLKQSRPPPPPRRPRLCQFWLRSECHLPEKTYSSKCTAFWLRFRLLCNMCFYT